MKSKADAIAEIRRLSPSVSAEFLAKFSDAQLDAYLHRLESSVRTQREIDFEPVAIIRRTRNAARERAIA